MKRFYKSISLLIFTFFYLQNSQAQIDTTKSLALKVRLIDSICVNISKTDTNTVNTMQDAQMMLTKCMSGNSELYDNYVTAIGYDISKISEEKLQEIANSIALEVYNKCPALKVMINHVNSKKN